MPQPLAPPADAPAVPQFDARRTAALLPFDRLVEAIAIAAEDVRQGRIATPERLAVPLHAGGVMLSMPASAADIAIHKLVTVAPGNPARGLPTLHGQVVACDPVTGQMAFVLDGPALTARRTAAVSMLAIRVLAPHPPSTVLLIGSGRQAEAHALALAALWPEARCRVLGRSAARLGALQARLAHIGIAIEPVHDGQEAFRHADVVVTTTTSRTPIYDEPAQPGRLVVAVGAFTPDAAEIGPRTVRGSRLAVDDPRGARGEAGDLLQAGVDWAAVTSLAERLCAPRDTGSAWLFKSVGCAAWDLAACRVARDMMASAAPAFTASARSPLS